MSDFTKDPDAVLDYALDWAAWLAGDTIATASWTADGVTVDSQTNTTTVATVWLSGGTVGTPAAATCRITTASGRTEDRTLTFTIEER